MTSSTRRALVVGSGGREHALAWLFREAGYEVSVAPGNGGTAAELRVTNVDERSLPVEPLLEHVAREPYDIVIVGPEAPLAAGIGDRLSEMGVPCVAPSRLATRVESDKAWAKALMRSVGIETPKAVVCASLQEVDHALSMQEAAVLKANGLASGKGVFVGPHSELRERARALLDGALGEAGLRVLVEERVAGDEYSVFALTDGERFSLLPPVRDYKRALDGDEGLNTGGMGAVVDPGFAKPGFLDEVRAIVMRMLGALRDVSSPFAGVLYVGLMVSENSIQVLEWNARLGDPEMQALAPLLPPAFVRGLEGIAKGRFEPEPLSLAASHSVAVSVVAESYPLGRAEGEQIALGDEGLVFHGGTELRHLPNGRDALFATGGRVCTAVGVGSTRERARREAYRAAGKVRFQGARYRTDIGR